MSGYRDSDPVDLDCRMWDSLQNMLASIELRLDALEEKSHACHHEWHGDQATMKNFCRLCGTEQPEYK